MKTKTIYHRTQEFERSISRIGAKVADAVDLSQKAKELRDSLEALLIDVQQELEELYISMGDPSEASK